MALGDAQFEKLRAHIIKHEKHRDCPVCGNTRWSLDGPFVMQGYRPARGQVPSAIEGPALPVAVAICTTCHYVRTFAYLPFVEPEKPEEGASDG